MNKAKRELSRDEQIELSFLEALRRHRPDDIAILKAVGDLYTKAGRFAEGLELDLRLAGLCPDDRLVRYNLACSHAMLDRKDEAFAELQKAIELGYRDFFWMARDPDLLGLHGDPRFGGLMKQTPGQEGTIRGET